MHSYYLQLAVDQAAANVQAGGGPFAAVLVKEQTIIASAGNRVTADLDPTAHAEILAIRAGCRAVGDFQLNDCILYCSCEPCPMCLGAIYWARLAAVYYACSRSDAAQAGFDDQFIYQELGKAESARQLPMRRLQIAGADLPFKAWLDLAARRAY